MDRFDYGVQVSWDLKALKLADDANYRFQIMAHDGDSTKIGGDVGQACKSFLSYLSSDFRMSLWLRSRKKFIVSSFSNLCIGVNIVVQCPAGFHSVPGQPKCKACDTTPLPADGKWTWFCSPTMVPLPKKDSPNQPYVLTKVPISKLAQEPYLTYLRDSMYSLSNTNFLSLLFYQFWFINSFLSLISRYWLQTKRNYCRQRRIQN